MAFLTDNLRSALGAAQRFNPFARFGASTALSNAFTNQLALAAYMSSGMLRKVIAIPAEDRVREWRDWQAEKDQIAAIEAEEKRLGLIAKVKAAEILRGIGGGALILITNTNDHSQPLKPETIVKGGLIAINVVSRWQIQGQDWIRDLASPEYGQPRMFLINGDGDEKRIHPSRVICFRGDPLPAGSAVPFEEAFWGDSKILRVFCEVERADQAQAWFAELVKKAKLLRIGIPDLDQMDKDRLAKRVEVIAMGESTLNATLYRSKSGPDGSGEELTDYQITWTGIPAMMDAFDQRVAAVSDIPFTRLMGRSPAGMNATGKSDQENWNKMVAAGQLLETRPCLEQLDPILIRSAGVDATDITWRFAPLDVPSEKDEADTFKTGMEAIEKLQNTGTIPEVALAKGVQNWLAEREYLPGLDQALAEIPEDERFGLTPEPSDDDPSALTETNNGGKEGIKSSAGAPGGDGSTARRRAANDRRFADATPRTLYGRRDVVNTADIQAWAKAQGIPDLNDDLHVTLVYSRTPIDWMKIDGEWNQDEKGQITIQPGGVRIVEPLGNQSAVLLFTSSALTWRHESIVRSGASHDYPDYQPHISLTKAPIDLSKVEPYRGKIVLGPEVFEEIDEAR